MKARPKIRLLHMKLLLLVILTLGLPLLAIMPFSAGAAGEPQLTLTPNYGFSDTPVRMHGVNFSPNMEVRIKWQSLLYGDIYTSTASAGIFDLMSNVPDGLAAGNYVVTAVDANGNTASANFTLYTVFNDGGFVGIKSAKQIVQWKYNSTSFYCDSWQLFHNSQNNWYNLMVQDYGLYILRLTYNGTTYVFDLANGAFNAWPVPLVEKVSGFEVKAEDPSHLQGKITIYNPTGSVLLATIVVDITAPGPSESYYTVVFKITAEANLSDLALYTAYNLNVYQPPNSAIYYQDIDGICQYYGPSHYGSEIPEQYKGAAGFASFSPSSTHHDADINYMKVLSVANYMRDYDFNYRDRNEVHADSFGNVGIGLQWTIGALNKKANATVPMVFAASDTTVEALKDSITKGKVSLQKSSLTPPTINLATSQAPGTSIIGVSGQDFMPYAKIDLRFGGVLIASFATDSTGVFEGNFLVPTSVTGNYSVTATDKYGLQAKANFTVVELTLKWVLDRLDSLEANVVGVVKDVNGSLGVLINTTSGNILAKLSDVNASLTNLVVDEKGNILARIDTAVGQINATVEDINARLTGIIGNATGDVLARIDSKVGETLVKVDQINATLVGIIGSATGDVLARIDSRVGETLVKVDAINATIVGLIGDSEGDILARIDSTVGQILVKVDQINATLVGIIGTATGDILARIDTRVGETLVKVDQINATIVGIVGDAKGDVLARIDSKVGEILVKVDQINATIVGIIGDAKGDLLARIDTRVGQILVKVDQINGTLVDVVGDAKSGVLARIDTKVGQALVKLDAINASIVDIVGDAKSGVLARIDTRVGEALVKLETINGRMASIENNVVTIKTDVGDLQVSLSELKAKVTAINGSVATIQTSLGTLIGNITSMQGDIATIKTDIGTLKLTTKPLTSQIDLQPFNILAVVEIIALVSIIYTIYTLRMRRRHVGFPALEKIIASPAPEKIVASPAPEKIVQKRRYRKTAATAKAEPLSKNQ